MSTKLPYRKAKNFIILCMVILCTAIAVIPLLSIIGYIMVKGYMAIDLNFFTRLPGPPSDQEGGIANAITGTITLVGIASVIGIPIGILSAIYLNEYGRKTGFLSSTTHFVIDVMLGTPSIVVGIFAYIAVVRPFGGFSALSGGFALGIMMIPIVARASEEIIRLVPDTLREASYGLGIPKWRTIVSIVIPYANKGIVTGVMLGVARAAGETAPLLLTAFGNEHWNDSLFEPIASLPHQIFKYATSPYDNWIEKAWGAALVLIGMVLLLNIAARILTRGKFKNIT